MSTRPDKRQSRQKHGKGEGTIGRRADGRWEARLTLPGGRRKSWYGATRQEVQQALARARYELEERGIEPADERTTLGQWLATWLEQIKPSVSPRTWVRYEYSVRLHILPTLGKARLARLTATQVQSLYGRLMIEPSAGKRHVVQGAGSVRAVHATLHKALSDALRMGITQRNVASAVRAPRAPEREMTPLTREQVRHLLDTAATSDDRLSALWTLALATGMRIGELLALHWRDVDLSRGKLSVKWTLLTRKGGFDLKEPKTQSSRRQIALGADVVAALKRHQTAQKAERLRMGEVWQDLGLVFCREDGYYLRSSSVNRALSALLRRAGLPAMRVHDLRHEAATLALWANEHAFKVQSMLGHSSLDMLKRYSHVTQDMQESLAETMNRALFG